MVALHHHESHYGDSFAGRSSSLSRSPTARLPLAPPSAGELGRGEGERLLFGGNLYIFTLKKDSDQVDNNSLKLAALVAIKLVEVEPMESWLGRLRWLGCRPHACKGSHR